MADKLFSIVKNVRTQAEYNYVTIHLYKRIMSLNTPCELCKVQP